MKARALTPRATAKLTPKAPARAAAACGDDAARAPIWLIPPRNPGNLDLIAVWSTTASSADPKAPATRWTTLMALVAWPIAA